MATEERQDLEYAGFWIRIWAHIIDGILWSVITLPVLWAMYGTQYFEFENTVAGPIDFLISWLFPPLAVITFWVYKSATPGKMAISVKIVDAQSGERPSTGQFVGRYFAYIISLLPLGLGVFWIAFDKKKQGWHDKLAGTVVVRKVERGAEAVAFENKP